MLAELSDGRGQNILSISWPGVCALYVVLVVFVDQGACWALCRRLIM